MSRVFARKINSRHLTGKIAVERIERFEQQRFNHVGQQVLQHCSHFVYGIGARPQELRHVFSILLLDEFHELLLLLDFAASSENTLLGQIGRFRQEVNQLQDLRSVLHSFCQRLFGDFIFLGGRQGETFVGLGFSSWRQTVNSGHEIEDKKNWKSNQKTMNIVAYTHSSVHWSRKKDRCILTKDQDLSICFKVRV